MLIFLTDPRKNCVSSTYILCLFIFFQPSLPNMVYFSLIHTFTPTKRMWITCIGFKERFVLGERICQKSKVFIVVYGRVSGRFVGSLDVRFVGRICKIPIDGFNWLTHFDSGVLLCGLCCWRRCFGKWGWGQPLMGFFFWWVSHMIIYY